MTSIKEEENRYLVIFCLIAAMIFLDTAFYGAVVPLIPVYTAMFHLSSLDLGIIISAYAIGLVLFSIPLGIIAEKYGYKKLFVLGMFSLAMSCGLFLLVTSSWMLIAGRIVQGISGAATWTTGLALVAKMYPDQQGRMIGILMGAVGFGTIAGPPIGGALYEVFGYHNMFAVLGGICLLLCLTVLLIKFGDLDKGNPTKRELQWSFVWKNRRLMWFCLIFIFASSCFGILDVVLPNRMHDSFGMTTMGIGLFFGATGVVNAISDMTIGNLSDKYGFVPFIKYGLIATALTIPLMGISPNIPWLFIAMILFGISAGAAITPAQPYMYQIVIDDPELKNTGGGGFAYGLMNTCYSIGLFIGPLMGGALNDACGFLFTLITYAVILLLAAAIFFVKVARPEKLIPAGAAAEEMVSEEKA